ncbi:MAG: hypothetical protein ACI84R_003903, partial [Candidatus Azotimanducaceae bacterium]
MLSGNLCAISCGGIDENYQSYRIGCDRGVNWR